VEQPNTAYFWAMAIASSVGGIVLVGLAVTGVFPTAAEGGAAFAFALAFASVANVVAFRILGRMKAAGYEVGFWRMSRDYRLYSDYWRIAPERGWSRAPLVILIAAGAGMFASFALILLLNQH
jgi:hypothetical protein